MEMREIEHSITNIKADTNRTEILKIAARRAWKKTKHTAMILPMVAMLTISGTSLPPVNSHWIESAMRSQGQAIEQSYVSGHELKHAQIGLSATRDPCSTMASETKISSTPDYGLDGTFWAYANSSKGWTGGDSGVSVKLPDGRTVWLYSDSYMGNVVNGSRQGIVPFMHNVAVVQDGNSFTTLHGGTYESPKSLMTAGLEPGSFYWNNGAIVSDNTLYVSYSNMHYLGNATLWGFKSSGTILAEYSLPSITLKSVTQLSSKEGITWGAWMLDEGGYTYIYGTKADNNGLVLQNYMYVARAPRADILGGWKYFDGTGWTNDQSLSVPITNAADGQFSVTKLGSMYILVTMQDLPYSDKLMMYFGCSPTGPFVDGKVAYTTVGQTGAYGTNGDPDIYTYGAYAHPGLSKGNTLVISYDVDSSNWGELNSNVNIVRPRFIDVTVSFANSEG